ncbi:MAG TPA: alpha-amylase, partial [Bacteroidia bacterium]|nr:alpha-amylase [Bacteroidia bacterium]
MGKCFRHPLLAIVVGLMALSCNPPAPQITLDNDQAQDSVETKTVKPIIYQLLVRHFSNANPTRKPWGTLAENGIGKFSGVNEAALTELRNLGITHIWYTGVLEHATTAAFPEAGIEADDADVVKGRLGSPYAIKDYYDVSPTLADDPKMRMV